MAARSGRCTGRRFWRRDNGRRRPVRWQVLAWHRTFASSKIHTRQQNLKAKGARSDVAIALLGEDPAVVPVEQEKEKERSSEATQRAYPTTS
ncbi:hypothetical protein GOP47_0026802 [Adiantum capillus-veneris]|nr:hypothetical protein GOP47_0026802 [Adiantum capillus-veneris]